ncbi:hypothetical protein [Nocardioides silvaticus]|nr:hypothetical protein [Nocardioides silvaticus]
MFAHPLPDPESRTERRKRRPRRSDRPSAGRGLAAAGVVLVHDRRL